MFSVCLPKLYKDRDRGPLTRRGITITHRLSSRELAWMRSITPRSEASELCMWSPSPQWPPACWAICNAYQSTPEHRTAAVSKQIWPGKTRSKRSLPASLQFLHLSPPPSRASTLCSNQSEGFALPGSGYFVLLSICT